MRRVPGILFMAVLLLAWPLAATTGAGQATRAAQGAEPRLRADFDGDGAADLAIGPPGEGLGAGQGAAGVVHVLYGSAAGLTGPAASCGPKTPPESLASPRRAMALAGRWPAATSTATAAGTWPWGPDKRTRAAAWSTCWSAHPPG